jgi:hypothetical protein
MNTFLTMQKVFLSETEIDEIISFVLPRKLIPRDVAEQQVKTIKRLYREDLKKIQIYPQQIPKLKSMMQKSYEKSMLCAGESVGVLAATSIGERSTQATLNTFNMSGTSKAITTSCSGFEELINATKDPSSQTCIMYFNSNNETISALREQIGYSLIEMNLDKLMTSYEIHIDKKREKWYDAYEMLYKKENPYTDCITVHLDKQKIYEYKLKLSTIAEAIDKLFPSQLFTIHSPNCFSRLDIFVKTEDIEIPDSQHLDVTSVTAKEIFLDDRTFLKYIRYTQLFGMTGIKDIRYIKNTKTDPQTWFIETKGINFNNQLVFDNVCSDTVEPSNIWHIHSVLGIEAMRQYMINQIGNMLGNINYCQYLLLIDQMTFGGSASAVTRHTVMADGANAGPISGCCFEQPYKVLLNGAQNAIVDNCASVSASIVIGENAKIGTNFGIELHTM